MRVWAFLLIPLAVNLAAAAPVPKETESEKIKRLYGTLVDPDKDCTISLDGNVLRIRVPGKPHGLIPQRGMVNAPRVVREIDGDFTADVKIRLLKPTGADQPPARFVAGLVIHAGDQTMVYHARQLDLSRPAVRLSGVHGVVVGGKQNRSGSSGGGIFSAETATFRLARVRDKIKLAASSGNGQWHNMPELTVPFPDRVTIGVYAGQDGVTPFTAEFEEFILTRSSGQPGKP